MSKFRNFILGVASLVFAFVGTADAQDAAKGEKVFKKCRACHAVGEGAKNKVGPHLNDLFGRTAGTLDGFKYSKAMVEAGTAGLVWDDDTISEYLAKPRGFIPKNRMSFSGLKKEQERTSVIAYLKQFSADQAEAAKQVTPASKGTAEMAVAAAPKAPATTPVPDHGVFKLGRKALPEEVSAWDIDVRPDGTGLPQGRGTVARGEELYSEKCAHCHGDFGEGIDRWPILAGGHDTLTDDRPEKTVGSYWPYLSTVYDYVRRAMPFGDARSLSDDDVYAITAFILYLNDVVDDEEFELSHENFNGITLPNAQNFIADGRAKEPHYASGVEPCMKDCRKGPAKVTMRARVLDVTPDAGGEDEGAVAID